MNELTVVFSTNSSKHSNCFAVYLKSQVFFRFGFIYSGVGSAINAISGF
jgi:hypothetical protein